MALDFKEAWPTNLCYDICLFSSLASFDRAFFTHLRIYQRCHQLAKHFLVKTYQVVGTWAAWLDLGPEALKHLDHMLRLSIINKMEASIEKVPILDPIHISP